MRTLNKIILLTVLALLLSSCKDIFVTTKINKDGSFTRIITIKGDSSDVYSTITPYPVDASWEREFTHDASDSSKFILTYKKFYPNSDILNSEIKGDTSKMKVFPRKIEIRKQFGFFYSYLTFSETYSAYNPFTVDYKKYLTDEDLEWLSGNKVVISQEDSLKLEIANTKLDEYIEGAVIEEVMAGLKKGINRLNDSTLNLKVLQQYSDSIERWVVSDLYSDTALLDLLSEKTGIESFSKLKELNPPALNEYNESILKFQSMLEFEGFKQTVELPGIITETNSNELIGNQVNWEVDPDSFFIKNYTMYAESRVVNYWAFIVAGIVILSLLILLIVKGFRK